MIRNNLYIKFLLVFALYLGVQEPIFAQRLKNKSIVGDAEIVHFEASRVGNIIEFTWRINTTRNIVTIEIRKGIPERINNDQLDWELLKEVDKGENKCFDYNPDEGQMFYKLILKDINGVSTEYEPKYTVKGKS